MTNISNPGTALIGAICTLMVTIIIIATIAKGIIGGPRHRIEAPPRYAKRAFENKSKSPRYIDPENIPSDQGPAYRSNYSPGSTGLYGGNLQAIPNVPGFPNAELSTELPPDYEDTDANEPNTTSAADRFADKTIHDLFLRYDGNKNESD